MQCAMIKLYDYWQYMITDLHDGIVMACPKSKVESIIETIVPKLYSPIDGYELPLRVSVGKTWREWQDIIEYRNGRWASCNRD